MATDKLAPKGYFVWLHVANVVTAVACGLTSAVVPTKIDPAYVVPMMQVTVDIALLILLPLFCAYLGNKFFTFIVCALYCVALWKSWQLVAYWGEVHVGRVPNPFVALLTIASILSGFIGFPTVFALRGDPPSYDLDTMCMKSRGTQMSVLFAWNESL